MTLHVMQAIQTKYIPASNTKGSRVKATTGSGISLTVSWDHGLDQAENHKAVAEALANKLGWYDKHQHLEGGALKDTYVWVLVAN